MNAPITLIVFALNLLWDAACFGVAAYAVF